MAKTIKTVDDILNNKTITNAMLKTIIENLIKFYAKNGFTRIENTQYLVRNMDYKY